MKMNLVLFPTDFSRPSYVACDFAYRLARESGAKLMIVHVQDTLTAFGGGEVPVVLPEVDTEVVEERLRKIRPGTDVEIEYRLLIGPAGQEIVALAEGEGADMIVLGTHGRSGISRLLLGSVAEQVLRRAPCPVLTVKATDKTLELTETSSQFA